MAQLVTRVDEALLHEVDEFIAQGGAANRSELVRMGLERLLEEHRRRKIGQQIAAGYQLFPETSTDLMGLDAATRALILEEPW
jgi:metal-responsive CopG/Arc/MetJ family transcriptional regulator